MFSRDFIFQSSMIFAVHYLIKKELDYLKEADIINLSSKRGRKRERKVHIIKTLRFFL